MKSRSNDSAGQQQVTESTTDAAIQLLISVRDEQEIDDAIAGGADIVDLKEPRQGALAPTTVELWNTVSQRTSRSAADPLANDLPGSIRFSAALGESDQAICLARSLPACFAFAKAGPRNCDTPERLISLWTTVLGRLNRATELVAVAYADHEAACCPPVEQVFQLAADFGFQRCLVDTLAKDGRSTADHLGLDGLRGLAAVAKQRGLWWALAGSIRLELVDRFTRNQIQPNCYGIRGDVCDGDRQGMLAVARVRQWKQVCAAGPEAAGPEAAGPEAAGPEAAAGSDAVIRPSRVLSGS